MSLNYWPKGVDWANEFGAVQIHSGGGNYAFVDGHAKWYRPEALYGAATPFSVAGNNPTFHIHD